jgi:hypothetical protein
LRAKATSSIKAEPESHRAADRGPRDQKSLIAIGQAERSARQAASRSIRRARDPAIESQVGNSRLGRHSPRHP